MRKCDVFESTTLKLYQHVNIINAWLTPCHRPLMSKNTWPISNLVKDVYHKLLLIEYFGQKFILK